MAVSAEYLEYVKDILAPFGEVSIKRMFGGAGIYHDGVMFGLIADEVFYLKADETTSPDYKAEGKGPFIYEGKGKPYAMPYWELPERLHDDTDELADWAGKAYSVALRSKKTKK